MTPPGASGRLRRAVRPPRRPDDRIRRRVARHALHARYDAIIDRALVYAPYPVAPDLWQRLEL
jgi:hypothetical protein